MSIHQQSSERQEAEMSEAERMRHIGPLSDQRLEQIAFQIFSFRFPGKLYADPLFHAERSDCRRLTLRLATVLCANWTLGNAASNLAEQLMHLAFGDRTPTPRQQKEVSDYAEACIADFVPIFTGDQSESWKYVPEDEPDDSELEDLRRVN